MKTKFYANLKDIVMIWTSDFKINKSVVNVIDKIDRE